MKNMKMLTALLKDHIELNEEHEDVKRERRTMNLRIDIMKRILFSIFKLGSIFDKKSVLSMKKYCIFEKKNIGAGPLYAALFLKFTKAKNLSAGTF